MLDDLGKLRMVPLREWRDSRQSPGFPLPAVGKGYESIGVYPKFPQDFPRRVITTRLFHFAQDGARPRPGGNA